MDVTPLTQDRITEFRDALEAVFGDMENAGFYPPHLLRQYRDVYTPSALQAKVESPEDLILGVLHRDRLGGFLIAHKSPDDTLYIEWMGTIVERRNQGVGSALLTSAVNWAQRHSLKEVRLLVSEKNAPARKFYAARGFTLIRKRSIADWQFLALSRPVAASRIPPMNAAAD